MLVIIVYFTPWIIVLLLSIPKIIGLWKRFKTQTGSAVNNKENEDLIHWNDVPLSELRKVKPIIISQVWLLVKIISFIYMIPITLVRLAIIGRWGIKSTWILPISFYDIWQLLFLSISFYYSYNGKPMIGIILAFIVGISAFYFIFSGLEKENGTFKIIQTPIHKLNLRNIVEISIVLVIVFGAVYYALATINPNTFSSKLSIIDSIYFSVITVATVGYGDISPIANSAKYLVILEIFLGMLYMLFIGSIFLTILVKRHIDEVEHQGEKKDSHLNEEQ